MSAPLDLRFVTSAPDVGSMPASGAEVCLAGRSNVGKSSLLNALGGSRKLAKVSSSPGRTRLLNVFAVGDRGTLVDLPGYGYAAASKQDRAAWQRRLETYLTQRPALRRCLLLVDGVIGPAKLDLQMLAWLRAHDVAFDIVATKHDKVKPSARERRKRDLASACGVGGSAVRWVSTERDVGIDGLRRHITEVLEGPAPRPL